MLFRDKTVMIDNDPESPKDRFAKFAKMLVALAILGLGILATLAIFKSSPKAEPVVKEQLTPKVQTMRVSASSLQIPLKLQGLTEPADTRQLSSNLNGSIISISEKLRDNQIINKGEWLFKVDNTQGELEISQAKGNIQTAQTHLRTIEATVASNAQALRDLGVTPPSNPPQLTEARLKIKLAQDQLKALQERAGKVNMYAPFSGKVVKSLVSATDFVSIGRPLAQMISSDRLIAKLPITDRDLELLDQSNFTNGNKQAVTVSNSSDTQQWSASIIGLETGNNLNGQFNYLVTEIYHPFKSTEQSLSIGANVNASIISKPLENIIKLPIAMVRNGNEVWTLTKDQRLKINNVTIIHKDASSAFISSGLNANAEVIKTIISFPVDGMQLKRS